MRSPNPRAATVAALAGALLVSGPPTTGGVWGGPMDAASVAAIRNCNVNAVRVPLNPGCWLGLDNVDPAYRGTAYQNAVKDYVSLLKENGITPILELHRSRGLWTGHDSHRETAAAECYVDTLMAWLDAHGASYLGWTWNTWDCSGGPSLISSYDGTPTPYGAGLRDHLLSP